MIRTDLFAYPFRHADRTDIGSKRSSNQDEVICCPQYGFFAVSDGMGGLSGGGETSKMIVKALPTLMGKAYAKLRRENSIELAAELLSKQIRLISDKIYGALNKGI